jgi:hypothetical protein
MPRASSIRFAVSLASLDGCGSKTKSNGFDIGPEIFAGIGPCVPCVRKTAPTSDVLWIGQKHIVEMAHRGFEKYVDADVGDSNVEVLFSRLFHLAARQNFSSKSNDLHT